MAHASSLHSDGINFPLFHYLWNKTSSYRRLQEHSDLKKTKLSGQLNSGNNIRIPDTVIFQFGQPLHWYFTSENRGQQPTILRKRKQNLSVDKIEEVFLSKGKREGLCIEKGEGSDILAYFISSAASEDRGGSLSSNIEYFDGEGLRE